MRCGGGGQQSREPELGVDQLRSTFCVFFINDDGDFNFRGGYKLNIDPVSAKAFKHSRRDTRMRSHSDSYDAQLRHATCSVQAVAAKLAHHRHQDLTGVFQLILVDRE